MLIVGVDIAKWSHEAVVINQGGTILRKPFNFKNTQDGFSRFLGELSKINTDTAAFTIVMESTSHYWIALYSALVKHGYHTQVMNPIQSNALRNLYIRQVKSDARDCFVIAEVVRFGNDSKGCIQMTDLFELRELCRARTFIVDMCADLKKKVIGLLDQVFPEYETLFSHIFGMTSMELLAHCATPDEIIAIPTEKLAELLEGPSRKRFSTKKAEEIQSVAKTSFGIVIGLDSMSLLIKQHVEHIRFMESQIHEIEEKIATLFAQFPCQITTIPGIGPVLGATIYSEIGDISRFSSAAKLTAFAGLDPTVNQSGEYSSTHNHMSKRGSPYLRRAIWQAATVAVMHDPAMKAFFQKKRQEGKPYMNAIGHVTRKLTSIIYAVLRDQKAYYIR